jgi:hypothetical protein
MREYNLYEQSVDFTRCNRQCSVGEMRMGEGLCICLRTELILGFIDEICVSLKYDDCEKKKLNLNLVIESQQMYHEMLHTGRINL